MMLAASISLHWEGTTEEQPIQLRVEFLVRGGLTLIPMIMSTLQWVITTSAEILMGIPMGRGALPLTLTLKHSTALFPSVPHQKGK